MSKKTKDNTIDFLYLNNNSRKPKQKSKAKRKTDNKNKNVPKKQLSKKENKGLGDEIIIGLEPKKETKKPNKNIQQKSKKINKSKKPIKKTVKNNKKKKTIRDPKIRRRRQKIVKWTSLIVIFLGITFAFMMSPIFNIKQINIKGIEKLSREEIINLSQIKLDDNTFKVKGIDVIKRIEDNNYIETADIKRELPSAITITVKERTPRYLINTEEGFAYVDSKGYILEISTEILPLPVLMGYDTSMETITDYINTKKLSDEDCKKIKRVNEIFVAAENNSVLSYITSIDITNINDIKLNLDTEGKVAYLGNGTDANTRILFLKTMIKEEAGKQGEAFINGDINNQKPKPYFRERV